MKAIVTGATGMVGVAIIKQLIKKDCEIVAIVRPNSKNILRLPKYDKIQIVECELSQLSTLNDICGNVFFHLAWDGVYGERRDNPLIQKTNIDMTFDAIDLANRSGCKKFVFAGSQAELGKQKCKIGCENIPNPNMNYGYAKLLCNTLGKRYAQSLGMQYNSGRILSAYGENDTPTTLISLLIKKLKNNEEIQVSDCKHIWDYINVEDVAKAFVLIAERGVDGKIYPIGSGEEKPLKYYTEIIASIIGQGKIIYGNPVPNNMINYLCADISELTNDTGFIPQIPFEYGIERLIESNLL